MIRQTCDVWLNQSEEPVRIEIVDRHTASTGHDFTTLEIGPVTFYIRLGQLFKLANRLESYLAQKSTTEDRCQAPGDRQSDPSPPSCTTGPTCDGTCYPLLPTFTGEAITEIDETA